MNAKWHNAVEASDLSYIAKKLAWAITRYFRDMNPSYASFQPTQLANAAELDLATTQAGLRELIEHGHLRRLDYYAAVPAPHYALIVKAQAAA